MDHQPWPEAGQGERRGFGRGTESGGRGTNCVLVCPGHAQRLVTAQTIRAKVNATAL